MIFVFIANAHDPVTAAFVRNVSPAGEGFSKGFWQICAGNGAIPCPDLEAGSYGFFKSA
jgi:hypothetical protein